MKKIFNYFSVALCLGFMVSCEPSMADDGGFLFGLDDVPGNNNTGNPGQVQKSIKKIVEKDSDGEVLTVDYTYASNKLSVVKAKSTDGDDNTYNLIYNGDIITKIDLIQNDPAGVMKVTMDLTYASGKLSKASGKGIMDGTDSFTNVSVFSYTAGKLSKVSTTYTGESQPAPFLQVESTLGYTGDNLSTWKLSTAYAGLPIVMDTTFGNYDAFKNPFSAVPEAFTIFSTNYGTGTSAFGGLSKNNYQSLKTTVMGMIANVTCVYTYDKDGYPTKGVRSDGGSITFTYN